MEQGSLTGTTSYRSKKWRSQLTAEGRQRFMPAGAQAMRSAHGAGRDSHRHDVAHIDCGVGVPHQHHIECVGADLCDLG